MRPFYLIAAILGFILPYAFLLPFFAENGLNFPLFIQQLSANQITLALSMDLLVSSLVFWGFLYHEGSRLRINRLWVYVLLNLLVGLSFALPVFLYVREGKVSNPA